MTFGKWVRSRRQALELTIDQCAKAAKVSPSVWSNWENDDGERRKDTVKKIATALGVDEAEALSAAFPQAYTPEAEFSHILSGLSDQHKRIVINAAKAVKESLVAA